MNWAAGRRPGSKSNEAGARGEAGCGMHPACNAPWFGKIDSALRRPTHTVGRTAAARNGREAGRLRDAHQGNDGGSDSTELFLQGSDGAQRLSGAGKGMTATASEGLLRTR